MEKKQVYIITKEFMGLDYERQQRVTTTEEKAIAIKEEMVEEASAILKDDMMDDFDNEYNLKLDTEYRWYLYDDDYSIGAEVYIEILDVE